MRKSVPAAAALAAAMASVAIAAPAIAAPPLSMGSSSTIASGLVGPLSMDVDAAGTAYVAQSFAGELTKVAPGGAISSLASAPGQEIGAVTVRNGTVYYAQSAFDLSSTVMMAVPAGGGTPVQLADIKAYESANNPDQTLEYGFVGISDECAAQIPAGQPGAYTGLVDSHPYGAVAGSGGVYVADAAANAIFRVKYDGSISTLAVLPPAAPLDITPEFAAANGYPACVADYPFVAESVPTDIEIGPGGWLYVSTLPGGPEDPSLGGRGAVYKVHPGTKQVVQVATGFGGATGLAVSPTLGVVFVAELFGGPNGTGQVSAVLPGAKKASVSVPVSGPAAVELKGTKLYVSRNALEPDATGAPQGKVTVVPLLGLLG